MFGLSQGFNQHEGVESPDAPPKYRVIVHRDEYTTLVFAVALFMHVFSFSLMSAIRLAIQVQRDGKAVAGVYSAEMAETKTWIANTVARHEGHPLLFVMERT